MVHQCQHKTANGQQCKRLIKGRRKYCWQHQTVEVPNQKVRMAKNNNKASTSPKPSSPKLKSPKSASPKLSSPKLKSPKSTSPKPSLSLKPVSKIGTFEIIDNGGVSFKVVISKPKNYKVAIYKVEYDW